MILFALAVAAAVQWTGPRTEEYLGPGYFCGGGYRISLAHGDRALVLPQASGAPGARVILSGHNVAIWTGGRPEGGRTVLRMPGELVTQQNDGSGIAYVISDENDFALRLTSESFQGFKRDAWFFRHADFRTGSDQGVNCLAARSY